MTVALAAIAASGSAARAAAMERVSVSSTEGQGNDYSEHAAISGDGRYVAFSGVASNLVDDDTNGASDVFLRDRQQGTTVRVSVASDGTQGNNHSHLADVSDDGRYVVFVSSATNLVPGDSDDACTEGEDHDGGGSDGGGPGPVSMTCEDAFVHDVLNGTTRRVSVSSTGAESNGHAHYPVSISGDGRRVAFASPADNLVNGDTNDTDDVFVHDLETHATTRVSVGAAGEQLNAGSAGPAISATGRYVAFWSAATNLPGGEGNGADIFVHDLSTGTTSPLGYSTIDGQPPTMDSFHPSISRDGSRVTFMSYASNLVDGDTNYSYDLFLHDRSTGTTELINRSDSGTQMVSRDDAQISDDGRFATFRGGGVYVRDLDARTTTRVDVRQDGGAPNGGSSWAQPSADGRFIAFDSRASDLVDGDTNQRIDVFVSDRGGAPGGDSDGDGIADALDPDPSAPSSSFDDGGGTTGSVVDRGGLSIAISDAAAPAGVRIVTGPGSGRARLSVCGGFVLEVAPGSDIVVTCGSVRVAVAAGTATVVLGGGLTLVEVPAGSDAKVSDNPDGTYRVENLGGGEVALTVDGVVSTIAPGATIDARTWDFQGFNAPVDNPGVVNVVKAGQSVPLRWRLLDAGGAAVTSLSTARVTVTGVPCEAGSSDDRLEEIASGSSGLRNLGDGFYQYNWATPKSYANSCKRARLDLGGGLTRDALFRFTR